MIFGIQYFAIKRLTNALYKVELQPSAKPTAKDLNTIAQARKVFEKSKHDPFTSKSRKLAFHRLLISAEYRIAKYGTKAQRLKEPHPQLLARLKKIAEEWKPKHLPFNGQPLTIEDHDPLIELACYPQFLQLLLDDPNPHHLHHFFRWSLLNKLSVSVFVEFPAIAQRIETSYLKSRIGAFGGKALEFHEKEGKKDVTLLMESKPISLLDLSAPVKLTKGLTLTVDQIFQAFRAKNKIEGNLTFFEEGICNWDPHLMGPLDPANKKVSSIKIGTRSQPFPNWHKQLRMKAHLTAQEATEKFGFPCDGKKWVMTVVANRQTQHIETFGAHSFVRLAIPRGDGSYDYTFGWGKFAHRYPQNIMETASMLFGASHATLEYPDNNEYYTSRQRKEFHFPMSPERGVACLESFRQDLVKVREKRLWFQILVGNCTDWVVKKVCRFVGSKESQLFDIPFYEIRARGFFGRLVKILRHAPAWFRFGLLTFIAFILGGARQLKLLRSNGETKTISVLKRPPWKEGGRPFRHPGIAFRS